jgi:hypothetical protein
MSWVALATPQRVALVGALLHLSRAGVLMSSAGQATPPTSKVQSIIEALADYAKVIGIDLFKNLFSVILERSNSLEAILQLPHGREKGSDESPIAIAIFFGKKKKIEVAFGDGSTASAQQ